MVDFKKLLPKKEEEEEYFWSLLIEPGWVQSGIWKIEDKKAIVIITSPTTPWNSNDDLVSASDITLSSAIQNFPETLKEPSKTVFGVSSSWVSEGQINDEHLEKIKNLCSELSLTPIGFVVLPEALAHYKKTVEESLLDAVILGVYKENLEINVFSMGKLLGSSQVARSVSLEDDVAEGLSRFTSLENIPSRLILYNGKEGELEDARQSLLKVNWDDFDKLKFLHTPKIEIVDIKTKVYAVCLAGASELAGVTALEIAESFVDSDKDDVDIDLNKVNEPELKDMREDTIPINKFTSDKIDNPDIEDEVLESEKIQEEDNLEPEDLGFVIDKDINSEISTSQEKDEDLSQEIENYHQNVEPIKEEKVKQKFNFFLGGVLRKRLDKSMNKLFRLVHSIKLPGGPGVSAGKKIFITGLVFLLLIIGLGFAAWWFLPKATVTIYLSPLKLGENLDIKVDTQDDMTDGEEGLISGNVASVSVSGEKTKDTTGTKTVGEKASGKIVLYRVGPEIDLDLGTTISGPEGLKFTLNSDITVASGSASSPGTTSANVSASDIGSQYNLAGGTSFSVANFSTSDIEAKNEESFSGGSSREISAVSEEDQKVLEEDLLGELSEQAKTKLTIEIDKEKYFIEESVSVSVSSKEFSADVEEEVSTLKLSLEVEAKAVMIEKIALNEYSIKFLQDKVPEGYVLRQEQISYEFELKDEDDGLYEFNIRMSANLLPEINKDEIAQKLRGKYKVWAEDYLNREVTGFTGAEIKIKPNLPEKIQTLPHILKNIDVEFSAEK